MNVLSDSIEIFIKEQMGAESELSIRRNELAQYFACAPSQINYVLSTRFTLSRGYIIVSRRGGGGYIRVLRVDTDKDRLLHGVVLSIDDEISLRTANDMIERLSGEAIISDREAALLCAGMGALTIPVKEMENAIRARVLREMLTALMQCEEE